MSSIFNTEPGFRPQVSLLVGKYIATYIRQIIQLDVTLKNDGDRKLRSVVYLPVSIVILSITNDL